MTDKQYQGAIASMRRFCSGYKASANRADVDHYIDSGMDNPDEDAIHKKAMQHIAWMLENMPPNDEKGMRWLGFVQGVLWSMCEATIWNFQQVNKGEDIFR